ncbi:MAG: hypothetical protein RL557_615 [archaeon]|jgi:hypothetical protein
MTAKQKIKEAQQKAASQAALGVLEENRHNLVELNKVFNQTHSLDAFLALQNGELVLIMPATNREDTTYVETALLNSVEDALSSYNPEKRMCGGYHSFALQPSRKKRLPRSLELSVDGLSFNIGITRAKIDFENDTQEIKVRTRRRQSQRESLPQSEWYQPSVKKGFAFAIDRSNYDEQYKLLPLTKETRPYFPGLEVPFTLQYQSLEFQTHVTCAPAERKKGELAGTYISKGISSLFRTHPEVRDADILEVNVIAPRQKYKIISCK